MSENAEHASVLPKTSLQSWFLMFSLLLLALSAWQILATVCYKAFFPTVTRDMSFLVYHKKIQYLLLFSGWLIPFGLHRLMAPHVGGPVARRFLWVFSAGAMVLGVSVFSPMRFLLGFAVAAALMRWAPGLAGVSAKRSGKRAWLWRGLVGIFGVALFLIARPRCDYRVIDLYDDGPKLAAVNQYLLGGRPYRDMLIHYGPLRDIVQPLIAFRLWGTTYDAEQKIRAWVQAFGILLLFGITVQAVRHKAWALWVGLLLLIRNDLWVPERVAPVLLAVFFFCHSLRKESNRSWLNAMHAAGFLSVAAALYTFEMGFTLMVGTGFYFVLALADPDRQSTGQRLRDWTLGAVAALAALFLYAVWVKGFGFFFSDLYVLLVQRLGSWADELPSHYFTFRPWSYPQDLIPYLYIHVPPLLAFLTTGYLLWTSSQRRCLARWHQALFLSAVLFIQYLIYMSRSDFNHWKNSTGLLWPLAALIADEAIFWARRAGEEGIWDHLLVLGWATLVGLAMGCYLAGFSTLQASAMNFIADPLLSSSELERPAHPEDPVRLGPLPGDPLLLHEIRTMTAWIQLEVPPEGYLFLFMNHGGYYFLANRRNPTRFGLIDYIHGESMIQECLRDLAARPPDAIVVFRKKGNSEGWNYRPDLKPIAAYLAARYKPKYQMGDQILLTPVQRKPPPRSG